MTSNKNRFRFWMRSNYPETKVTTVYGEPAFLIDKPLSEEDAFLAHQQDLNNGNYIVFVGIKSSQVLDCFNRIKACNYRTRRPTLNAPTTFGCFEVWCSNRHIDCSKRTHQYQKTPLEVFNCDASLIQGPVAHTDNWYLYELQDVGVYDFSKVPHVCYPEQGLTYVLIKAGGKQNIYHSKRKQLSEYLALMEPIKTQMITSIARGDEITTAAMFNVYMHMRFHRNDSKTILCNYDALKKALDNNQLELYLTSWEEEDEAEEEPEDDDQVGSPFEI